MAPWINILSSEVGGLFSFVRIFQIGAQYYSSCQIQGEALKGNSSTETNRPTYRMKLDSREETDDMSGNKDIPVLEMLLLKTKPITTK